MELPKLRHKGRLDPLAAKSMAVYSLAWKKFSEWLGGREPSWELAQKWLEEILESHKPATVALYGNALRKILPAQGIPKPSEDFELLLPAQARKIPHYLEENELLRVIKVAATPLEKVVLLVLIETGLRISEFLALDVADVDFNKRFVFAHREKVHLDGWIPISEGALVAIREYMKWGNVKVKSGRMFPYEYRDIYDLIKRVGAKAGVKLNPHLFRHSFAALRRIKFNQPIEDLQQFLGHKNIQTTMIYANIKPQDLQDKYRSVI